jgi:hypothetical protein
MDGTASVTSPKLPIPASGEIMMVMVATNEEPKMTPTRVVVKTWDKYRLRETLMAGIALVFFYKLLSRAKVNRGDFCCLTALGFWLPSRRVPGRLAHVKIMLDRNMGQQKKRDLKAVRQLPPGRLPLNLNALVHPLCLRKFLQLPYLNVRLPDSIFHQEKSPRCSVVRRYLLSAVHGLSR